VSRGKSPDEELEIAVTFERRGGRNLAADAF